MDHDAAAVDWASVALGREFSARPLTLSLARILAFSGGPLDEPGWPQRNLHTDAGKAREAGLDGIIASGTQSEGLLIGLLLELFGAHWYDGGVLDVRFLQPVRVGDTVAPIVRLADRVVVDGGLQLTLSCRCETHPGSSVIEGTALVTLRASPTPGECP